MASTITLNDIITEDMLKYSIGDNYSGEVGVQSFVVTDINFYAGTKPATADTGITNQTLLARITHVANPWYGTINNTGTAIELLYRPETTTATYQSIASGTLSFFRTFSDGGLPMFDGTIGTSDADLVLDTVSLGANDEIVLTKFSVLAPYEL
jgi:hypothetical protein